MNTSKQLAAVPPPEPKPEPEPIHTSVAFVMFAVMRIAQLEAENARLLKAVQRESHHIDVRTGHSGRDAVLGRKP